MSKECLSMLEAAKKLTYSIASMGNEIATNKDCRIMGADTTALSKYTSDYECPADDDIVRAASMTLTDGSYTFLGNLTLRTPTVISNSNQSVTVNIAPYSSGATKTTITVRFILPVAQSVQVILTSLYDLNTGKSDSWRVAQVNGYKITTFSGFCQFLNDGPSAVNFSFSYNNTGYSGVIDKLTQHGAGM